MVNSDSTDIEVERLVSKAQSGDREALTALFEQHRDRLRRMVQLRMDQRIQPRVAVSDVLQEAYIDLAQQLPNYAKNPRLPFFLWLRRITGQRLAQVHRRHLTREKRNVDREVRLRNEQIPDASSRYMAAELIAPLTSVSSQAMREETRLKLLEFVETMPENDREIIAMRHIEQLTNEEVAHLLDLSEKAASMRYTRAIIRLRDLLDQIPGALD